LPAAAGAGRPRRYDRQSCRQRDYEARALARQHGLADDEVVVDRSQLQDLHDRIYVVEAALEDVATDLGERRTPARVQAALEHLTAAAAGLRGYVLAPRTQPHPPRR
jgi:hypothetical protein